jgi:hypothetical protein
MASAHLFLPGLLCVSVVLTHCTPPSPQGGGAEAPVARVRPMVGVSGGDRSSVELSVFINDPAPSVIGDLPMVHFMIMNQSSEELTLEGIPVRDRGQWLQGEIVFQGPNVRLRDSSAPRPARVPMVIPPAHLGEGSFSLADHAEFTGPGTCTYRVTMEVRTPSGARLSLTSQQRWLHFAPVPPAYRSDRGEAIRSTVAAIMAYHRWNSRFPPSLPGVLPHSPRFPPLLTTPVAYLRAENVRGADGLAVLSAGQTFAVAAPGPDNDWDVAPLFDDPALDEEQLRLLRYDPTNGADSDGDLLVTRGDL